MILLRIDKFNPAYKHLDTDYYLPQFGTEMCMNKYVITQIFVNDLTSSKSNFPREPRYFQVSLNVSHFG